jgi:3-oxoacyl-[acyl-carrier protein] reductase
VEGATSSTLVSAERLKAIAAANPMGRLARPTEVAQTVSFLASDASGFTTGHYVPVSGGFGI